MLFSQVLTGGIHLLVKSIICDTGELLAIAVTVQEVYHFPNSPYASIENLGVRSNGQILLSTPRSPTTYLIDPTVRSPSPQLLQTYPGGLSTLGLTETIPDVWAIIVGNYSSATRSAGVQGSFAIWKLDLSAGLPGTATKVVSIPEAEALNGTTLAPGSTNLVLAADSGLGAVWSIDMNTGVYAKVIENSYFAPREDTGINGIHTRGSTLHFTNSNQDIYGSIPITSSGAAAGAVTIIAKTFSASDAYDDFAFDARGNVYVATHPNSVSKIISSGSQYFFVGNNTGFIQPTSVAFGRGIVNQECTLYVATAGSPTNSSGDLVAISNC
jgi:hypothetical protein